MKIHLGRVASWQELAPTNLELPAMTQGQKMFAELESSAVLASSGIDFVPSLFGSTDDQPRLAALVAQKGWKRLVVKANAHDVPHRNRLGLVRVGVDVEALPMVLAELGERLDRESQDPKRGLLVQPMIGFDEEIGVGALLDPRYGPAMLVGPGGVGIESATGSRDVLLLSTDAATYDAFAERVEARYHLNAGSVRPVIDAVAHLMASGQVAEIDINPMVRTKEGTLMALDALVVADKSLHTVG